MMGLHPIIIHHYMICRGKLVFSISRCTVHSLHTRCYSYVTLTCPIKKNRATASKFEANITSSRIPIYCKFMGVILRKIFENAPCKFDRILSGWTYFVHMDRPYQNALTLAPVPYLTLALGQLDLRQLAHTPHAECGVGCVFQERGKRLWTQLFFKIGAHSIVLVRKICDEM